jgi:hypothetical protein
MAALKQWWFDFMARLRLMSLLVTLPAVAMCVAILSSCATATIDNAVPQAAQVTPDQKPLPTPVQPGEIASANPTVPLLTSTATPSMPNNTGQYPNINVMPIGETAQFTPTDEAAARALLDSAKAGQQVQGESTAAYQERLKRLRLLAKTHAGDTIKQIEGK